MPFLPSCPVTFCVSCLKYLVFHLVTISSTLPGGAISLEADLEYLGGAKLTIETRLDVREARGFKALGFKGEGSGAEGGEASSSSATVDEGTHNVLSQNHSSRK